MLKPSLLYLVHGVRNDRSQWQTGESFSFPHPLYEHNLRPNTHLQCILINSDNIMKDRDNFIFILENSFVYKTVIL